VQVNELVRLIDEAYTQEELLRGRNMVGGFGMNRHVQAPSADARQPDSKPAELSKSLSLPNIMKAGSAKPALSLGSVAVAKMAASNKRWGGGMSLRPVEEDSVGDAPEAKLGMDAALAASPTHSTAGGSRGLFGRAKKPKASELGLPGYSSMFSAPPGEGPLEKALASASTSVTAFLH
jgi:hypothetical protein